MLALLIGMDRKRCKSNKFVGLKWSGEETSAEKEYETSPVSLMVVMAIDWTSAIAAFLFDCWYIQPKPVVSYSPT